MGAVLMSNDLSNVVKELQNTVATLSAQVAALTAYIATTTRPLTSDELIPTKGEAQKLAPNPPPFPGSVTPKRIAGQTVDAIDALAKQLQPDKAGPNP